MTPEESLYLSIGQSMNDTVQSQLFGKPCFKTGGKAFICFFQNEMVFKLMGDVHKEAIELPGSTLFDPSGKGRPMKEWVQVSYNHKDKWQKFAEAALKYAIGNRKTMQ
ncbi:hypothetical protein F0919_06195 [Taibaiella lutea]|uniref:TfoX N-terminal domain-containing protein n=1 Tax=Taibaiella lutea TaxID=2608001 RepID=A0A5M6CVL2_9BACT|nr:hypothetical protein [Taibaiella lutea]KAA5537259.1 hypothetical protein F0919_06195 [Taibaiella lutea]